MDAFIVTDLLSHLRVACPAPDQSAESTTMALRTFAGSRKIHISYVDRSGEISRSLKTLEIMPTGSQPGVPQTNPVAKRANDDGLVGTRSLLFDGGVAALFLGVRHAMLLPTR